MDRELGYETRICPWPLSWIAVFRALQASAYKRVITDIKKIPTKPNETNQPNKQKNLTKSQQEKKKKNHTKPRTNKKSPKSSNSLFHLENLLEESSRQMGELL